MVAAAPKNTAGFSHRLWVAAGLLGLPPFLQGPAAVHSDTMKESIGVTLVEAKDRLDHRRVDTAVGDLDRRHRSHPRRCQEPRESLWQAYWENPGPETRARLVESYLPLVLHIANQVLAKLPAFVDRATLVQNGSFGLIDAIDRFDRHRGIQFDTFACLKIRGAILDGVRATDWVPRVVRRREREVAAVAAQLEAELKRSPTTDEVLAEAGLTPKKYEEHRSQVARGRVAELPTEETRLPASTSDPAAAFERAEEMRELARAIEDLPERQRQVIELYYFEERTLKETGSLLGITESGACRLHAKAVRAVLSYLEGT